MNKKAVAKRISEIRKRLEEHNTHKNGTYVFDPKEIRQIRELHDHAVDDITFLLDQIK